MDHLPKTKIWRNRRFKIYLSKQTRESLLSTWQGLQRFKYLPRRTVADRVLRDKAFNIVKNLKYDGYQRGVASMFISFLIKILWVVLLKMKQCKIKD